MALLVYWYDFICFGIVGVALFGALYVLWRREGDGKCDDRTSYESLLPLVTQAESDGCATAGGGARVSPTRGHVSSSQLWTSCWKGLHPIWLLGLRFLSLVVMTGFLTWDMLEYDASIFVYYTEWTFALVIVYFAVCQALYPFNFYLRCLASYVLASHVGTTFHTPGYTHVLNAENIGAIVSAHGCLMSALKKPPVGVNQREEFLEMDVKERLSTNVSKVKGIRDIIQLQTHCYQEAMQQRAGFWGYLMQTAYQTCAGAVILTDIVFWGVIVPFLSNAHLQVNALMGCMHTLNAIFLLLDTTVNNLPFPWFRLAYFVLWSCCYVIFLWVMHACGFSWWPYPFLELSTPWAPFWYFCMAAVHIPCYGLYLLLVRAKNSIFGRLFPRTFVGSY